MAFVLVLVLLLPPALAVAAWRNCKFEQTVGLVVLGVIATGYVFALFGLVWMVPWLLYAAFAGACAYLVYALFIKKSVKPAGLISFGLVAFLVLAVALWWLCRGRMFYFWDDFTHWGLAPKSMYFLDDLYTKAPPSGEFFEYPPAGALWVYVMLKAALCGFREDVALFIQSLFILSLLVYPLGRFEWKKAGLGSVCALVLFTIPASLNSDMYVRLLVDGLMGVLLAYIFFVHFLGRQDKNSWLCTVLACFVLSITKAAGVGLAAMAAVVVLANILFLQREQLKARWARGKAKCLLWLAAPAGGVLFGWLSWRILCWAHAAPVRWNTGSVGFGTLVDLICGNAPDYHYTVVRKFFENMFVVPANGQLVRFPSAVWFLIYAALGAAVFFLLKKGRRRPYMLALGGMAGIHLLFMAGLLFSYLALFTKGEATMVASFYRYEATVATAGLMVGVGFLLVLAQEHKLPVRLVAGAGAVAVVVLFCFSRQFLAGFLSAPTSAARTQQERFLPRQSAARIQALGEQRPRVYMISITDNRGAMIQLIYELVPVYLSNPQQRTSIAASDYYGSDPGGAVITPEDWAALLNEEYDYVYLYNIDGYFTTHYRSLFEEEDDIVNDVMLSVVRHEDGSITLRRLF